MDDGQGDCMRIANELSAWAMYKNAKCVLGGLYIHKCDEATSRDDAAGIKYWRDKYVALQLNNPPYNDYDAITAARKALNAEIAALQAEI